MRCVRDPMVPSPCLNVPGARDRKIPPRRGVETGNPTRSILCYTNTFRNLRYRRLRTSDGVGSPALFRNINSGLPAQVVLVLQWSCLSVIPCSFRTRLPVSTQTRPCHSMNPLDEYTHSLTFVHIRPWGRTTRNSWCGSLILKRGHY